MELNKKNILVVGLGVTGLATARFLHKRGAVVTVTDMASEEDIGSPALELQELGIRTELGFHRRESFESAELIIISPGVPHKLDILKSAEEKGIPVLGEIELAFRFIKSPVIAITGTNGKTTTTSLLGAILAGCGMKVFVGGNIGNPLIAFADSEEEVDWIVLEISSFQLDTIKTFRPEIGILLNISEDHLERYNGMEEYASSKARIFENQTPEDIAIMNGNDQWTSSVIGNIKSRRWFFNLSAGSHEEGSLISENDLTFVFKSSPLLRKSSRSLKGIAKPYKIDLSGTRLYGKHNQENISAAVLAAIAAGGDCQNIESSLKKFDGLSHRLEYVRTANGVTYIDDSKATNTDAVCRALECFKNPVILIMGGRDKGGGYEMLKKVICGRVKHLVLIGEAAEIINETLGQTVPAVVVSSMEEAVKKAAVIASKGDVVLLSPACSSFDMFRSYAHRGDVFKMEVNKLQ